ncbi:MFS transporter [Kitasatospora sp. NPDC059327]|uniref:MFS transporter n=1 Tax=Kitasatospora sp. NPDC059327 TaxID=3346803 RepID=UPI0036B4E0BB
MTAPAQPTVRSPWLAFAAVVSMQLMMVLDISIVTVALRSIQEDLGFSQPRIAWVTTAYTLGFGGFLLLSGRLGDLFGKKRMFLTGMTVFLVASLFCGLSRNQDMLIAARFVQGAGAAMGFAVAMGIVFSLFRDPRESGKAMGGLGFVQAAGASVGIVAGGALTSGISWHWVFFLNLPIGIVAAVLVFRLVPNDRGAGFGDGADILGAVLVTVGMMLGVYTIATVGDEGWGSGHTIGYGLASLALLGGFVARQATAANPLMRLDVFRSRNLSGANLVHLFLVAGMISGNILIALYMQQVLGYSAATTGFAFLPIALSAAAVSLGFSARFNMRFGPKNVLLVSLVVVAASLLLAVRGPVDATYVVDVLPTALLLGVGTGLALPAVMTLAMAVSSPRDIGLASGLVGTSGMVGDSLGIAVMTAVAAAHTKSELADGKPVLTALNDGYHLAFGLAAAVVVVGLVIGFAMLKPLPPMPHPGGGEPPTEAQPAPAGAEAGRA